MKGLDKQMDKRDFYPYSFEEARRNSSIDMYKQSLQANIDCKNLIEDTITKNHIDNRLKPGGAKKVLKQFGIDRPTYVLSFTLQQLTNEGRISKDNMDWAKETYVPEDNNNVDFFVDSHKGVLNIFVNQFRDELEKLKLWDKEQVNDTQNLDFEGKLMVLSPKVLKEEYKTRDEQLFFVTYVGSIPEQFAEQTTRGAGCMPGKVGKMVHGFFLKDNEKSQFERQDFIGEAKQEFLSKAEIKLKNQCINKFHNGELKEEKPIGSKPIEEKQKIKPISKNKKPTPKKENSNSIVKRESLLGRLNEAKKKVASNQNKADQEREGR